jgi:hypothetical protein
MHHERFDPLSRSLAITASRRGVLAALLPHPAGAEAKRNAARRRKPRKQEKKARKRVNECLLNAPPEICDCNPWATALCGQCWDDVSACCSQMRVSRLAGCTCLYDTGWGSCVR